MKYVKILILLLILTSSYFVLEVVKEKDAISSINELTTKTILKIQSKATAVLASLSIIVDAGPPRIFIDSPKNKTYNHEDDIELNFTVIDNNLDKIYYNIDDEENTTITGNITFSTDGSPQRSHTLKLFANDTLGQLNSTSIVFSINLSKGHEIDDNEFEEGETTNFDSINKSLMQNLSNVKIEKLDRGKIEFIDNLNISRDINISEYINISFNRIEVQSEFLSEFNKNATLKIYNLTFTNPRILKDNEVCLSSICKKNSYSNGLLSFNVTGFTIYSSEETPSSGTGAGTGGAGGGGGGGKSALTDFSINTNLVKVSLLQGETKREIIEIENTGTSILDLEIQLENIKDFLIFPGGVSKYNLKLNPKEKQSIQLIFNAAKDYKPGVYPGKIVINSPLTKKIITTIVEVESLRKVFDVDVKIQNKEVVRGSNLGAEIIIFNLGKDLGRVDTQVEYGIKDFDGNIITKEEKLIAVETQASSTVSILIPKYLVEGRYILYAIVRFDAEVGTATEIFEVISRPVGFVALSTVYIYFIPGFISIIITLIIVEYFRHYYKKKGLIKERPSIIKEIVQKYEKPKEKFNINQFLKNIEKEEIHGAHNRTLETKLKILKQNYNLGLINEEEYVRTKRRIEKILGRFG